MEQIAIIATHKSNAGGHNYRELLGYMKRTAINMHGITDTANAQLFIATEYCRWRDSFLRVSVLHYHLPAHSV
jgi:hypothetical protein